MTNVEYLAAKVEGTFYIVNGINLTLTGLEFRLERDNFKGNDYDVSYLTGKTLFQLARKIKRQLHNNTKNVHIYTVSSDNTMSEVITENSDNTMSEIKTTQLKWL